MNKRRGGFILILFGLIAAAAVGYLVLRVTQQATPQKVQTVDVVVALQDIPERTVLTPSLVAVRQVLPQGLPPGVLAKPEQVNGLMATTRLYAGEMILNSRLADTKGNSGIAYTLEPGKVLITWPGSDIIGLNAVKPGDHVDLLVTLLPPDKSDKSAATPTSGATGQPSAQPTPSPTRTAEDEQIPTTTQVTMQNLVVVGIGAYSLTNQDGKSGQNAAPAGGLVTFAVTHDDAVQLKFIKDFQRLRTELVLRAAGDETIVTTEPFTLQNVLDKYHLKANP